MTNTNETREVVVKAAWPVFMAVGFVALLVDGDIGFGIILFGMIAGAPLAAALFDSAILLSKWWSSDEQDTDTSTEDPLEVLRMRYAKGEIDEEEFEYKLSQILETKDETVTEPSY